MIERRGFLAGLIMAATAPAIIRTPRLLMPIKPQVKWGPPFEIIDSIVETEQGFTTMLQWGDTVSIADLQREFTTQMRDNLDRASFHLMRGLKNEIMTLAARCAEPPPVFLSQGGGHHDREEDRPVGGSRPLEGRTPDQS